MSELKRWDYNTYAGCADWYEDQEDGHFVVYDDVKELQAHAERLEDELLHVRSLFAYSYDKGITPITRGENS